jgi:hypothetical protein
MQNFRRHWTRTGLKFNEHPAGIPPDDLPQTGLWLSPSNLVSSRRLRRNRLRMSCSLPATAQKSDRSKSAEFERHCAAPLLREGKPHWSVWRAGMMAPHLV